MTLTDVQESRVNSEVIRFLNMNRTLTLSRVDMLNGCESKEEIDRLKMLLAHSGRLVTDLQEKLTPENIKNHL